MQGDHFGGQRSSCAIYFPKFSQIIPPLKTNKNIFPHFPPGLQLNPTLISSDSSTNIFYKSTHISSQLTTFHQLSLRLHSAHFHDVSQLFSRYQMASSQRPFFKFLKMQNASAEISTILASAPKNIDKNILSFLLIASRMLPEIRVKIAEYFDFHTTEALLKVFTSETIEDLFGISSSDYFNMRIKNFNSLFSHTFFASPGKYDENTGSLRYFHKITSQQGNISSETSYTITRFIQYDEYAYREFIFNSACENSRQIYYYHRNTDTHMTHPKPNTSVYITETETSDDSMLVPTMCKIEYSSFNARFITHRNTMYPNIGM